MFAVALWPPPFVSLTTQRTHSSHTCHLGLVSGSVLAVGPVLGQWRHVETCSELINDSHSVFTLFSNMNILVPED